MRPIPDTMTHSSRSTFLTCPMKYFYEYIMRLGPTKEPEYFTWGKVIHAVQEEMTNDHSFDFEGAVAKVRAKVDARVDDWQRDDFDDETVDGMLQGAVSACAGWLKRWMNEHQLYEMQGAEQQFSFALNCGTIFRGKIDGILKNTRTGDLLTHEYKTAARVGDAYWVALQLLGQHKGYIAGARRSLGVAVVGTLYDIFAKPQIHQRVMESRGSYYKRSGERMLIEYDTYYHRRTYPESQMSIDVHLRELETTALMIGRCMETGEWVKHHPANRTGGCPFTPLCLAESDEAREQIIATSFRIRSPEEIHPELEATDE